MRKYLVILFINLAVTLNANESTTIKELVLLNNPLVNSGVYKDSNLTIDNTSFGREFSFSNNLETSLYVSYSSNSNNDKYYGLKSSLGIHNNFNKNITYSAGVSALFIKDKKISNESTIYSNIKYQKKGKYNPYINLRVNYNIFNLASKQKATTGTEAYINSGFNIDALKSYEKLPITFSPYVQTAFYSNKIYQQVGFSQLYTIGLGFDYHIGEYLDKNNPLHSSKVKFKMQQTFSNKELTGHNFSLKFSLFDF